MGNGSVLTPKQVLEFGSAVLQQLPVDISPEDYEYWTRHKTELGPLLKKALTRRKQVPTQPSLRRAFANSRSLKDLGCPEFWKEMWKYLDWEFNPSGLFVPTEQRGFSWLIGMPKDMTDNMSFNLNAGSFNCWRWIENLDKAIVHNDRDARNGAYFIRVRNRIEADKELNNLSARTLWERKISGITHAEREVLEQAVWLVSGKHLDVKNATLCFGSRYSDGLVPEVRWQINFQRLRVRWCNPNSAGAFLCGRSVVSN